MKRKKSGRPVGRPLHDFSATYALILATAKFRKLSINKTVDEMKLESFDLYIDNYDNTPREVKPATIKRRLYEFKLHLEKASHPGSTVARSERAIIDRSQILGLTNILFEQLKEADRSYQEAGQIGVNPVVKGGFFRTSSRH